MAVELAAKPGPWIAGPDSCDPEYSEFWADLFCFIPFHHPATTTYFGGDAELMHFGSSATPFFDGDAATEADWVETEMGTGLKLNANAGVGDGVRLPTDGGLQFSLGGFGPFACALMFEYDGTDRPATRHLLGSRQGGTVPR